MRYSIAAAAAFVTYLLAALISLGVALLIKAMSAVISETLHISRSRIVKGFIAWVNFRKSLISSRE